MYLQHYHLEAVNMQRYVRIEHCIETKNQEMEKEMRGGGF